MFSFSNMSKLIPSVAPADEQYHDLFGGEDMMMLNLAIDVTPLFQVKPAPART